MIEDLEGRVEVVNFACPDVSFVLLKPLVHIWDFSYTIDSSKPTDPDVYQARRD